MNFSGDCATTSQRIREYNKINIYKRMAQISHVSLTSTSLIQIIGSILTDQSACKGLQAMTE